MGTFLKAILPLAVIAACIFFAGLLIRTAPKAERTPQESAPLFVDVHSIERFEPEIRIPVRGQLQARFNSQIASEVSGAVLSVHPQFQRGGLIKSGETLVTIDAANYQTALTVAEADLASAQLELELEQSRAQQASREWRELGQRGEPSALTLRKPQLARAKSQVSAAQSRLAQARRDLERTQIKAPFTARIQQVSTERGSVLNPGSPVAQLFPVDAYEISLPVALADLPWVPLEGEQAKAYFQLKLGQDTQALEAHILRTVGEVDATTRTLDVIAEVRPAQSPEEQVAKASETPEGDQNQATTPAQPEANPLLETLIAPGLFLEGYIQGKSPGELLAIPRAGLISENEVLIVDQENRLRRRQFTPIWRDAQWIYAAESLTADSLKLGDLIVTTTLDNPIEGLSVELPPEPETEIETIETPEDENEEENKQEKEEEEWQDQVEVAPTEESEEVQQEEQQ